MDILVTGGTGVLGRAVVADLVARDHQVSVLTRRPGVTAAEVLGPSAAGDDHDPSRVRVVTGDLRGASGGDHAGGLGEALAAADAVVHCASDPRRHAEVDVEGTRNLIQRAEAVGRPHLLYVSIVGCDRLPYGYYRSKSLTELAIAQSDLPWTVLRVTQFHDLILTIAGQLTRPPVVPVPREVSDQPISVLDVAPRITELVESGPAGRAPDIGGPEVLSADQILRTVAHACGRERRFVSVPAFGKILRGVRAGHHLAPEGATGTRTFDQYVAEHVRNEDGRLQIDRAYSWR